MTDVFFYAFAVVVMWFSYRMLKRNNRQKAAERAPARVAEAAALGWTYAYEQTAMFETERWSGAMDGIEWVAEAARSGMKRSLSLTGDGAATGQSATLITRWSTKRPMPVSGPVLLMYSLGNERDAAANPISEVDSALGRKIIGAVLDMGLTVSFGKPIGSNVDGHALKPATLPDTGFDGYALMAADASEAFALLFQRVGPALAQLNATGGPTELSILITPEGLAVKVPRWVFKTDELLPLVNAGVALTKAMR